jgi:hypothetical protein
MDGTTLYLRVRDSLDDPYESPKKRGLFWTDLEIYYALSLSQDAVVSYLISRRMSWLLQRLLVNVASTTGSIPLPANYFHWASAQIDRDGLSLPDSYRPATLYINGASRDLFFNSTAYTAHIIGNVVHFRNQGAPANGLLWYYRTPSIITYPNFVDETPGQLSWLEPPDFTPRVYDVITSHATATLALKLENSKRFQSNMVESMQFAIAELERQHAIGTEGIVT